MRLKSGLTFLVIVTLFLVVGIYSNQERSRLVFSGESEHWKGNFRITGDQPWVDQELTLTFIGPNVPLDSDIHFSFTSPFGGGEVKGARLKKDQTVTFIGGGTGADLYRGPDEEVRVMIHWEGFQEVVVLKNIK
ncbi:hypothetical protein KDJ56_18980 [Brevibacillus composti]|uniref:Uncharacterized protein n=1 Tax=Brevibacillus composti TaxID=2796470 RepID=A0A7T5EJV8_9BACL|nr:hypothetical protein [Brevibacillus composti]QQE73932.1 hypothetical protein JD108_19045 [Brevibacillus composti]QUO41016.1 hypothetical protein KDJ56_18980 [Brevibacillus composti]